MDKENLHGQHDISLPTINIIAGIDLTRTGNFDFIILLYKFLSTFHTQQKFGCLYSSTRNETGEISSFI
jgi:hypothetical protein